LSYDTYCNGLYDNVYKDIARMNITCARINLSH